MGLHVTYQEWIINAQQKLFPWHLRNIVMQCILCELLWYLTWGQGNIFVTHVLNKEFSKLCNIFICLFVYFAISESSQVHKCVQFEHKQVHLESEMLKSWYYEKKPPVMSQNKYPSRQGVYRDVLTPHPLKTIYNKLCAWIRFSTWKK